MIGRERSPSRGRSRECRILGSEYKNKNKRRRELELSRAETEKIPPKNLKKNTEFTTKLGARRIKMVKKRS